MRLRRKSFFEEETCSLSYGGSPPIIYMVRSGATNALLGALAPKAKGAQPPGGGGEGKNQN
ncbi:hypothetical protein SGRA_2773 [Saprospira grandis str. Lewin]|uniref:Uncharacterized protein n=1 Tax=Saprospira grandis (strain Lewin) TaxID=984262 RepID=H6LA33_SAPGL|nr:hypothetical protein SGRA_2773 [Saprospira grandis str. Lewin]